MATAALPAVERGSAASGAQLCVVVLWYYSFGAWSTVAPKTGDFDLFQLQESRGFRRKIKRLEETNKKLALELEHERGKLTGLGQSNAALREHNSILETALAKRDADLVQLNLQVLELICRKQEETCCRPGRL